MGTHRQIIYNFVLDQIKLKLIRKIKICIQQLNINPTWVYKSLQPPVPPALVAAVLSGLEYLALAQLSQAAVKGYWLS